MSVLEELKKKISDIETQSLAMDGCRPTFTVSEIMDLIDGVESDKQKAESAQNVPNDDSISRKAAIDAVKRNTFRLTFSEERNCEGHVAWSAEAVYSDVMEGELLDLPPAQPEIIYCRECEKYGTKFCSMDIWTDQVTIRRAKPDDFCNKAEGQEEWKK